MNITNRFVFIHMPKTGGSFVADVLRKVHQTGRLHTALLRKESLLSAKYKLLNLIGAEIEYQEFNKHGTCREIPFAYAHLPILSCMRDPFDWYVSNYKYAWWRTHPQNYPGLKANPQWPELDFSEYLRLSNSEWLKLRNPNVNVNPSLGRLTTLFINYYCRRPDEVLSLQDDEALFDAIRSDMFPVTFMDTANLNRELYEFLLSLGQYEVDHIAFVLSKRKISPRNQRKVDDTWTSFFSEEQKSEIAYRDRLLFRLFPQYQIV